MAVGEVDMVSVPVTTLVLQQRLILEPAQHPQDTSLRVLASRARWEHLESLGGPRHTPTVESDATPPVTGSRGIRPRQSQ